MGVIRQRSIADALVQDQLHVLHAALEVSMEVSCDRRERDLVLLVGRVLAVCDM